ncbi:MAG: regulatory protein GemA [Gammaproteobacteria bacterium]|nr:regulatory protein GemA [Gammaproteobacteria bacterium]
MYAGKQLAKIHIGKKELGLDDEDYQAFLFGLTGKSSAKSLTIRQRLLVIAEMQKRGAFKTKPLTGQQKACVAKWYKLRNLGVVSSKDKSSLNRYIKKRFEKWNICDLTTDETNQLLGHLQGWIDKVEHKAKFPNEPIISQ